MFASSLLHSAYRAVEARVRESVLLEGAERAARAVPPAQHATMRRYYDAAKHRTEVANELADERGMVPALIVYREALQLLLAAVVTSRRREGDLEVDSLQGSAAWDQLFELVRQGRVVEPPASLQEARELFAQRDLLAFDSCTAADLAAKRAIVEQAIAWLTALLEPRTPAQIRVTRSIHVGLLAAVILGALVWGVVVLAKPVNVALHKPVTISKRYPGSAGPADNSGLVNGEIEAGYGLHTTTGSAWVMVDLLKPERIEKVSVFNRTDGWFDDGLPLILELSADGTHFTEVARATTGFTSTAPWTIEAGGRPARYVRIRSKTYIALTELEVYDGRSRLRHFLSELVSSQSK